MFNIDFVKYIDFNDKTLIYKVLIIILVLLLIIVYIRSSGPCKCNCIYSQKTEEGFDLYPQSLQNQESQIEECEADENLEFNLLSEQFNE